MKTLSHLILLISLSLIAKVGFTQTELDERAMSFDNGLGFNAPDSVFGITIRFRMQNRVGFQTASTDDFSIDNVDFRVRRLRLRFDGYILNHNLNYYIQLSFSRSDQEWDGQSAPNIIRDAMIYYHFNPKFYIGLGQGKLPGNRQRIISSGQLQFADRSNVNAEFNIDRDFGIMLYYSDNLAGIDYNLKGAISSGEGRNAPPTDAGLAYTARLELLPLGKFTNSGDFSEGDLEFEPKPKISLVAGYSFNDDAKKRAGQRGTGLYEQRDLKNFYADFMLKYMGWAWQTEYMQRRVDDPFTYSGEQMVFVYDGQGLSAQLSYCMQNYWELAFRAAKVTPSEKVETYTASQEEYTLGINKYIYRHKVKAQGNFSLIKTGAIENLTAEKEFFVVMFQIELGI